MKHYTRKPLVAAMSSLLVLGAAAVSAEKYVLEEIVVTAQKRAQSLQDVPVSINAVGGDKLNEAGIDKLEDMIAYVPNLSMSETGIGTQIFIRGIGSGINQGFEQSVGQYVDGIYYGRAQLSRAPFFDLERVEVLRGPQGILFGKNSIAGALSMITAKPTEDFEVEVSGLYEPDQNQKEMTLVVSGPITDNLKGRLAVRTNESDGYLDNTILDRDGPQRDEDAVRATLTWDVNDKLDITLKAERDTFDVKGRQIEIVDQVDMAPGVNYGNTLAALTLDPRVADSSQDYNRHANVDEYSENEVNNVTITANYQLGQNTLTLVSGWAGYEYEELCDCDFTGVDIFSLKSEEEYDQFSQEIRLVSPGGETVDWIVGAFYQDSEMDFKDRLTFSSTTLLAALNPALTSIADTSAPRTYSQDTETWAAFAQATWNINDAWSLNLGGRYTHEEKEGSRTLNAIDNATGESDYAAALVLKGFFNVDTEELAFFGAGDHNLKGDRTENAFTPSVSVQYTLNDDMMFYLSGSTGFKSGGYDTRANIVDSFEFDEEKATSFELGAKTTLLDGAAELNVALYHTTYKDLQTSQFDGTLGFLVGNADKAVVQGIEVDGRWALSEGLTLSGAMGYLDFVYKKFEDGNCYHDQADPEGDGLCDYSGRESQYTPHLTGNLSLDHVYPMGDMELHTTVDANYTSEYFIHPNLDPRWEQEAYTKINARLALEADSWSVALVGKNLTDKETLSYVNTAPLSASTFGLPAYYGFVEAPRTVAIQASYRY